MARLQDYPSVTPTSNDKFLIVQSQGQGLAPHTIKMDSANPTGTGSLSLNRKSGTTVGTNSVAEGRNGTASGNFSHAEGDNNTASGTQAHAEGYNNTASGTSSHVEGSTNVAKGIISHAEGYNTIASRRSQHVFGEYNVEDTGGADESAKGTYIEVVGKGTNINARSNARTLDWSGNEVLAGDLTINGSTSVGTAISGTDISSQFTPETGVNISSVQKFGKIIIITGATAKVTTANSFFNIGTFATGYRPTKTFSCALANSATADFGYGSGLIGSDGVVKGIYSKATTYGLYFSLIFVV